MGHILLHRYMHPTAYQANFDELASWLQNYSDHPTASRIYNLAKRRAPEGSRYILPAPQQKNYIKGSLETTLNTGDTFKPIPYKRTQDQEHSYRKLRNSIKQHIQNGFPTGAKEALQSAPVLSKISQSETDILWSQIALSYLIEGKEDQALSLASLVFERHGSEIPLSGWVSGIASWQQKRYALSAQYFQKTALSPYSDSWTASAASYWAARSYARMRNKDKTLYWIKEAALYPRTFYGLLANKTLNISDHFEWNSPTFTKEHRDLILSTPRGERAFYLAHIGLENLATMELEAIDTDRRPALKEAILSMAYHFQLSRFLFKFGNSFQNDRGHYYDIALFPEISAWNQYSPHQIDKAIIHAIVRQESRFKADAKSPNGAIGLMQLMPSTAAYIMGDERLSSRDQWKLTSPSMNLKIGEQYIQSLLKQPHIDNNLFHLLIAYNAGPGALKRWQDKIDVHNDPLLFIELLPSSETRAFVERVMTNLWVYRDRFQQNTPSLNAIIQDRQPIYQHLDN